MSANLVFATRPDNTILPFVVDVYKAMCKVGCQTHPVIPYQGVHIWIRLAWNDYETAAAFAAEPWLGIYYMAYPNRNMVAIIGQKAPEIDVSHWVQGMPTTIRQEKDRIVLIEVFQVNCPGCFLHGIPEAIDIYHRYGNDGVRVLGLATAFEDYDKNTLENLEALAKNGHVIGETHRALVQYGRLQNGSLPYRIPFPLGMDTLTPSEDAVTDQKVLDFIKSQLPNFDSEPSYRKRDLIDRVRNYMLSKKYAAHTFENYALQGTPSTILIDRKGILRDVSFGQPGVATAKIRALLNEG